jgi:hypothetical protein
MTGRIRTRIIRKGEEEDYLKELEEDTPVSEDSEETAQDEEDVDRKEDTDLPE